MTTIAELFVNLGVKGSDKAMEAVEKTQEGMDGIASSGLAAKAAIIGAVYGLERLTAFAGNQGRTLKRFADYTGLSADQLQRWQYMASLSGVSAEEMLGTIQNVQGAMSDMLLGKGPPEGLAFLKSTVDFDENRARDTFYVMDKLRQFAQATRSNPDVANKILESFGLSAATIAMLRTSRMELDKISPDKLYSAGEISRLTQVEQAWSKFWHNMKMINGRLVADYGKQSIQFLSNLSDGILKATSAMGKFMEQSKGWALALKGIAAGLALYFAPIISTLAIASYLVAEYGKMQKGEDNFFNSMNEAAQGAQNWFENKTGVKVPEWKPEWEADRSSPWRSGSSVPAGGPTFNISVNNHGVKDAQEAAELTRKEVGRAYRQMGAQKER